MNPGAFRIRQCLWQVRRLTTGETMFVPEGTERLITAWAADPDKGYKPPTDSDRWGWRDDVERRFGVSELLINDHGETTAPTLTLMDAEYRRNKLAEASNLASAATLFGWLNKELSQRRSVQADDVQAFAAAMDLANDRFGQMQHVCGPMPLTIAVRAPPKSTVAIRVVDAAADVRPHFTIFYIETRDL